MLNRLSRVPALASVAAAALMGIEAQAHEGGGPVDVHADYLADALANVDGGEERGAAVLGRAV